MVEDLLADAKVLGSDLQQLIRSEELEAALKASIPAIGDYYMTESTISPSTRWPGTTWVELAGRVLVGRDAAQTEFDTVGEQGGHKALQSHVHPVTMRKLGTNAYYEPYPSWTAEGATDNTQTGSAGTGDSGNLQPYRVCFIWRRTA